MKCPTCGYVPKSYEEHYLEEKGECFECSLWRKRLSRVNDPDIAIIDGTFYSIGDEDNPSPLRGFGGDKFVIRFKDDRKITTTNLWCGGHISEHWRPMFPDTADFDWEWKKIGNTSYLCPKDSEEIPDSLIAQAETNIGM